MNKRQAKKKFKKKYGMNPNDYYLVCNMDKIAESVQKVCDDIAKIMPDILRQMSESINNIIEDINKFVQSDEYKKIAQAVRELAKEKEEEEDRVIYSEDMVEKIVKHQVFGKKTRRINNDD